MTGTVSPLEHASTFRNALELADRLTQENNRLRAALQRIADSPNTPDDGLGSASVLSGIAWAALSAENLPDRSR